MVWVETKDKWQVLHITKGDDARISFVIQDMNTGEDYTMKPGDYITMTARDYPSTEGELLFEVKSYNKNIYLSHDIIDAIDVGVYSVDCELTQLDSTAKEGHYITTIFPNITSEKFQHAKERNWRNLCIDPETTKHS